MDQAPPPVISDTPPQDIGSLPVSPLPPPPPTPTSAPPSVSTANIAAPPAASSKFSKIFLFLGLFLALSLATILVFTLFNRGQSLTGQSVVTYWGLWEPETVMHELIAEYESSHPKVKIAYIQQKPSEYRERLQSALSQGHGPDIFRFHNTWTPMFKNYLQPIPVDVFSSTDFAATFHPVAQKDARLGANLVGIPLETDNLVMYTNDTLFSQAGLSTPLTWDELRLAATSIARCSTPDGRCTPGSRILTAGAALGSSSNIDHWEEIVALLMLQNNVNLSNPGKPTEQPAQDVINFYNSFVNQTYVWEPNLPNSTAFFAAGKLGIMFAPSWRAFDIFAANPTLKFSTHPVPQTPYDPTKDESPVAYATYWLEGVNSKSKISNEAWAFLKFLSSSNSLQKLYSTAIKEGRAFGEPYSRLDLSGQIINAPYVGSVIKQQPFSTSWFLASSTFDGPTGINSQLSTYYADLLSGKESLGNSGAAIAKILSNYGLATSP